ncbi:histone-lysine N-methyltransferase ash1, partial [Aspergillus ellipticus CBS 707.79]
GLRTKHAFTSNQMILEYIGEIVTKDECLDRMGNAYKSDKVGDFYLLAIDRNFVIDATKRGSLARFVNHSCQPNCRVESWIVGQEPRLALFANSRIEVNEELTFDYQFKPFSRQVDKCKCGSIRCRGVL